MIDIIYKILKNPLTSIVLALFGFYYAWYLYKKGKQNKALLLFTCFSSKLLDKNDFKINELEIKYKNSVITKLSSTKIAIFNSGDKTIYKKQIAPKDKLRLVVNSSLNIYNIKLSYINREPCNIELKIISNYEYEIVFDFLEKKDGFIIEVLHDSSLEIVEIANLFNVSGTLIETDGIKRQFFSDDFIEESLTKLSNIGIFGGAFISGLLGIFIYQNPNYFNINSIDLLPIFLTINIVVAILYFGY